MSEQSDLPADYAKALKNFGPPDANGHLTRYSDSSLYDEVCVLCGARDHLTDGDTLASTKCPHAQPTITPDPRPSRTLRRLIAAAEDSDLSDGGRYFSENLNNLTSCHHGDCGEYAQRADGLLVEHLWNNRGRIADLMDRAAQIEAAAKAVLGWWPPNSEEVSLAGKAKGSQFATDIQALRAALALPDKQA